MKFSIVSTTYNSNVTIHEFVKRMNEVLVVMQEKYEIIIVDDGSGDGTIETLKTLVIEYPNLKVLALSRNFGQHSAIMEGLRAARGKLTFLLDSDLEESPELFHEFYKVFQRNNLDVIYGIDNYLNRPIVNRILSKSFWKVFKYMSGLNIPTGICTVRLMSKRYVDALLKHNETKLFLAGLWQITGFKQSSFPINKGYKGSSSYSLMRKMNLAVESIVSFSEKPPRALIYFGTICAIMSLVLMTLLVLPSILLGSELSSLKVLVLSNFLFWSLLVLFSGLILLYMSIILQEVKSRPHAIVLEEYTIEKLKE